MSAGSENTERKQSWLFQPGQSGNPAGRPRGSRNRLGEIFLQALADDFVAHGAEAIAECRLTNPTGYVRVIAGLLPRNVAAEKAEFSQLSDAELEEFIKGGLGALYAEASEAADR